MKIYLILIIFISSIYSQENDDNLFITNFEYGQMLYTNPRGIGCIKCHGKKGEGMFITRYTHKKKTYDITAPAINNISLEKFTKVLKAKSSTSSIMPSYFLTNDEMKQIHLYVSNSENY